MWDFSIGRAIGILAGTLPFIALRIVIYFTITLAYVLGTGGAAGVGYGMGMMFGSGEDFAVWGGILGFGMVSFAVYWIREWLLYMVKAAHIAVMVELYEGRRLMPDGKGQIAHGRAVVESRFAEANLLFVLDQLIKGVIRAITGIIGGIGMAIPGLEGVTRFVNTVIRLSLTYVDEIILAHNIRTNSQNPWETGRQGLVLYAQNGGRMVKNAVWLAIVLWLVTAVIFVLLIGPALALVYLFPGAASGFGIAIAVVGALALKAAVLEPFAIAALMQVYFQAIEGQRPDPAWDAKLASVSRKFQDLKDRALAAAGRAA
ncbi:hypothetical protein [Rhizobium sp. AG855]|uniref:hypothetical protein n=1 Tax=Rhizobium sp. AG855 TaxID=2183898 RepID=UPI000E757077|nr:hypothetical protein [Rhizobium sp. AG855]RKE85844.1 hypothetical protein DFO46_2647 [Rhizobium sp. AG855]